MTFFDASIQFVDRGDYSAQWAKVELGIANKNVGDKRESIQNRDVDRELRQAKSKR